MEDIDMRQEAGNDVEQYQAGRDQIINKNSYIIETAGHLSVNSLKALLEAYKTEVQSPSPESAGEFIQKLNFFMNSVDEQFLTLEQKLEAGGFSSDIALALRLKQNYSMSLQKIKHISSAQKVHAYLLGMVLVNFSYVYYYLHKKGDRPDNIFIKDLINVKVITPIENMLSSTENALEVYSMEIHSMIYYLTGNCHIKWN